MPDADRQPGDGANIVAAAGVFTQPFDSEVLVTVRNAAAAHASELGMSDDQVDDLVLVVQELAANAVRHGGGRGTVRLWRTGGQIMCEVSDPGRARADLNTVGLTPQPPGNVGGRGLWIARQFTHRLDIHTSDGGTRVTATFDLTSTPPTAQPD